MIEFFIGLSIGFIVGALTTYGSGYRAGSRDREEIKFADQESWNARKKG